MTPTLLIDLDDTLLDNNIDTFLPAYLQALSRELAIFAEPKRLIDTLIAATGKMVKNTRPDCTLQEVFEGAFYPALGLKISAVQSAIEKFYSEVFPTLKKLTRSRPEAIRMVEQAFERGYHLVIATNPLFPLTANLQRLEWAGLPADQYPFTLVTSFENFHFAKPQPAFYAEILARLGWPEGPVVTVGDDLHRDIAASRKLGLAAFWLAEPGTTPPDGPEAPTASGSLADLIPWMENAPAPVLQPDYTAVSAMLAVLRSTPAVLDILSRDLPSEAWTKRPGPDEWSATEILCHLRDVEKEVNLPRIQLLLEQNNPFLAGKDTDPWAEQRQYIRQNGMQALHKFTASRLELLDLLEALQPEDWNKPARHAIFGPTRLAELMGINAGHDRLHVRQVEGAISATF
jgi:FMN phosphatase YigB (HAD superfamily)